MANCFYHVTSAGIQRWECICTLGPHSVTLPLLCHLFALIVIICYCSLAPSCLWVNTSGFVCVWTLWGSCFCCCKSVWAWRLHPAHLSADTGGGEGPRGEHTPTACVRVFQNRGQHLVIFYEGCTHTLVRWSPLELVDLRRILPCFLRNPEDHDLIHFFLALVEAVRRDHRRLLRTVCLTHTRTMPRSFLVKKYFAKQKPNYSELECQNGELGQFFKKIIISCMNYERILT